VTPTLLGHPTDHRRRRIRNSRALRHIPARIEGRLTDLRAVSHSIAAESLRSLRHVPLQHESQVFSNEYGRGIQDLFFGFGMERKLIGKPHDL